jgi:hypothetical protein
MGMGQPDEPHEVGGFLGLYSLGDWWFKTFTAEERAYIETHVEATAGWPDGHPLTEGIISTSQSAADFLFGLVSWFQKSGDTSITQRMQTKMDELARAYPAGTPGYYKGRHFTTWVSEVRALKRKGDTEGVERLLLALVNATEAECKAKGPHWGVAPWYYEELAKLYRARKDYAAEVAILERYEGLPHGGGSKPPQMAERLNKARLLAGYRIKPSLRG